MKNFYPVISAIKLCNEDFEAKRTLSSSEVVVTYDSIKIFLGEKVEATQYVKILYPEEKTESYELISSQAVYDDKDSQKHNGVAEFELKSDKLIFGETKAKEVANKILTKYCNGVPYIETEWRGSPMLDLGESLSSFSLKDPSEVRYECLSNDMSYDGGLKVKTKARKITAPKKITASK